ncbi:MAG: peptidoglycan recognition family protein, partial [Planctomycetota bacterium]
PMTDRAPETPEQTDRRDALRRMLTAGLSFAVVPALVACSSGASSRRTARSGAPTMPDPDWPTPRDLTMTPTRPRTRPSYEPVTPRPAPSRPGITTALPDNVTARSAWAGGDPVPSLMDRMTPIRRVTLHHDGMTTFTSTSSAAAQTRIEAIRAAHRGRGWGDIGYHYVVDPAGRIWQGRPLEWQGSHVGAQNQGNVGICVLGNYERQRPTIAQLDMIESFTAQLMRTHGVSLREVYTHRELASTACPGRFLQPRLVAMRENTGALARV